MNRDIRIAVEGSLLERLLKHALLAGACFARVQRTGPRSMIFTADPASAAILFRLCEKYGLNCRELSRKGRSALWGLFRRRWTLLPAMILCTAICILFLGRIWLIDIAFTGISGGNAAEIKSTLRENGIHAGMVSDKINCDLLQKQLLAHAGDYSFIGVRIQGIRLLVEAEQALPAPELYDIRQNRNLTAQRSGIVEEVHVFSGEACVQPGDTVLPGDILIRGRETIGKDTQNQERITRSVGALGRIIARCWFEGSAEGTLHLQMNRRTGRSQSECRLRLMNFSVPITECEAYSSSETETEHLPVIGLFLPLEIEKRTHWETKTEIIDTDIDSLRSKLTALARADALHQLEKEGMQYEIAAEWINENRNGNTLQIRAVYEIYTDIAAERDALN